MEYATVPEADHRMQSVVPKRNNSDIIRCGWRQRWLDRLPINRLKTETVPWGVLDVHPSHLRKLEQLTCEGGAMIMVAAINAVTAPTPHVLE
ncbi:hypothetical protein [Bradyrhizobium zhanjiangense]|uniref:hypothetical protein n=1 Tax=Bradyrhizobium zhanjiangense TaxID=1325107 RepID=UPI0013E8A93B|nr:hypothetical protein [Bradyrhizobium zhanjiangense]